jgi:hypothetical protein
MSYLHLYPPLALPAKIFPLDAANYKVDFDWSTDEHADWITFNSIVSTLERELAEIKNKP